MGERRGTSTAMVTVPVPERLLRLWTSQESRADGDSPGVPRGSTRHRSPRTSSVDSNHHAVAGPSLRGGI